MSDALAVFATNRVLSLKKQAETDDRFDMTIFTEDKYHPDYRAAGFTSVFSVPAMEDLTAVRTEFARLLEVVEPIGVIGGSERAVQPAGFVRSYFGLEGPGFEECARLTDKYLMKKTWRAAGLPVADFTAVRGLNHFQQAVSRLPLPLIVKPSRGNGAVQIVAVTTEQERANILASPPSYVTDEDFYTLIEEKLEVVDEYHVDAVLSDGKIRYDMVSRYLAPPMSWREPGIRGSYAVSPDDPAFSPVRALAASAVGALSVSSAVTHCEILETPHGLVVGEIAGRPGGGSVPLLMRHHLGVDVWDALVSTTLNRRIPVPVPDPSTTASSSVTACVILPEAERPLAGWTPVERIAEIPGVDQVILTCERGRTSGYRHSSAGSGYVVFHATPENVVSVAESITRSFKLVYA